MDLGMTFTIAKNISVHEGETDTEEKKTITKKNNSNTYACFIPFIGVLLLPERR